LAALSASAKDKLAASVDNTAEALSELKGDEAIAAAGALKQTVDAADKLFAWSAQTAAPVLRLELLASRETVIDV